MTTGVNRSRRTLHGRPLAVGPPLLLLVIPATLVVGIALSWLVNSFLVGFGALIGLAAIALVLSRARSHRHRVPQAPPTTKHRQGNEVHAHR